MAELLPPEESNHFIAPLSEPLTKFWFCGLRPSRACWDGDHIWTLGTVCVCVCVCTFAVSVAGADQTGRCPDSCSQPKKHMRMHTHTRKHAPPSVTQGVCSETYILNVIL